MGSRSPLTQCWCTTLFPLTINWALFSSRLVVPHLGLAGIPQPAPPSLGARGSPPHQLAYWTLDNATKTPAPARPAFEPLGGASPVRSVSIAASCRGDCDSLYATGGGPHGALSQRGCRPVVADLPRGRVEHNGRCAGPTRVHRIGACKSRPTDITWRGRRAPLWLRESLPTTAVVTGCRTGMTHRRHSRLNWAPAREKATAPSAAGGADRGENALWRQGSTPGVRPYWLSSAHMGHAPRNHPDPGHISRRMCVAVHARYLSRAARAHPRLTLLGPGV